MSLQFIALQIAQEGQTSIMTWLPLILIMVVFYFFMIRPQVKRQKELTKFREELKKGDNVVTTGGIYGKIADIKETHLLLQVDKDTRIKVDRNSVLRDFSEAGNK